MIDEQLQLASRAHIEAFIASWWGQGHHTNAAFQYILDRSERSDSPYQDLRWAVYYEAEGYGDPSVSEIVSDLEYLDSVFSHSGYLKINGRPVVFVYADGADRCDMVDRWAKAKAQVGGSPYVVLKVFSGYRDCGIQPDSWHQYGPASAYDSQLPYSVSVSPGFWKVGEEPRLSRDAARFESDVQRMVASGADWQLITTWNEWGEGSIVEASAEFGDTYVDILCRNLSGTTGCSSGDVVPEPAPEPSPSLTPSPTPSATPLEPSTGAQTFTATEDTFVKSTSPSSNYGGRSTLQADMSPSVKRALIRFQVSGLPNGASVSSVVLRMFVVDPSSQAGSAHLVAGAWSEATATWASAPSVGTKIADLSSPAETGSWVQADVTSAVSGNGAIDFYVVSSSNNGADYSSSERGDGNPPTLIVNWTGSSSTPTPTPTPAPVPPTTPGGDPILVGAGDIADCDSNGDESTAKLLDRVFAASGNGVVFTAGDNVYNAGTPDEFADCYDPSWGQYKARTRPSVGNHEYGNKHAAGYFDYFGVAAGEPGKGYYSYDLGAWHIVVLNSNCNKVGGCGAGSAQESWLRADLAANPSACTLAYWHHPRFSSGSHGNDTSVQAFWQALYDYGADVVLNGHDHDYERFAPQDPSGQADSVRGIRQFVVGMGGRNLYSFKNVQPNSEVRNSDTFGILKLALHATSYDWEFISVEGKTYDWKSKPVEGNFTDSGSQTCN